MMMSTIMMKMDMLEVEVVVKMEDNRANKENHNQKSNFKIY